MTDRFPSFAHEVDLSWEGFGEQHTAAPAPNPQPKAPTKGEQFFHDNPVHPDNIIAHWHAATPAEKDTGKNWYSSAHHIATAIAGGDSALGAGMVANYSGQTGLATNMHSASRALRAGRGLTGAKDHPGYTPGLFASGKQADTADQLLSGKHHSEVITSPKISNFAHLIEHPEDHENRVVVDRHALSVAVGRRVSDKDFSDASLSAKPRKGESVNRQYSLVADAYRVAAHKISEHEGQEIAPHQVQAVTWDVRRRLNDGDSDENDPKVKGRRQLAKNEKARWDQHVADFYPEHADSPHFKLSTRHLAYGETYAPQEVDTLRDEACKICGNSTNFRGRLCVQCGFIQPPAPFDDPDVGKAVQLNQLRRSIEQEADEADPSRSTPIIGDDEDGPVATVKGRL